MKQILAARFTIHNAPEMTEAGLKEISKWLNKQSRMLLNWQEVAQLSKRFTASFYVNNQNRKAK